METTFDDLGFSPAYAVEMGPEFPADGDWRCQVLGFDRDGHIVDPFESRWGAPVIVRVSPLGASGWVGMFAASGLGGVSGAYAAPSPEGICVLADGEAYLVDANRPGQGAQVVHHQVWQVVRVPDRSLVLLVRPIDIVALGASGVAWRTPRLAVADLWVLQATQNSVVCQCETFGGTPTIELDPATGQQVGGTRLDSFWPRGAL